MASKKKVMDQPPAPAPKAPGRKLEAKAGLGGGLETKSAKPASGGRGARSGTKPS